MRAVSTYKEADNVLRNQNGWLSPGAAEFLQYTNPLPKQPRSRPFANPEQIASKR